MNEPVRQLIRKRAGNRCEYCHLHQDDSPLARLHIEHIVPKKHAGTDDISNLALSCIDCNLHKGTNLSGIDPESGAVTELFNPRQQQWNEHFQWQGIHIVGLTAVGRTTIVVLAMNAEDQLALRSS